MSIAMSTTAASTSGAAGSADSSAPRRNSKRPKCNLFLKNLSFVFNFVFHRILGLGVRLVGTVVMGFVWFLVIWVNFYLIGFLFLDPFSFRLCYLGQIQLRLKSEQVFVCLFEDWDLGSLV